MSIVTPAHPAEFIPSDYFAPIVMGELFPRSAPLEVDVGCGDGAFLVARAKQSPERNFLGMELMRGRVCRVRGKASRAGLENARVFYIDCRYGVGSMLPRASVSVLHYYFPDPWPKRAHWPRRIFQADFLDSIHGALTQGGELRIKTDDQPYFRHMCAVLRQHTGFHEIEWPEEPDYPQTNFERRFVSRGLPIYRSRLVKL